MPVYTFRDVTTDEVFDVMMSIKDLDLYKQQHPTHERYFDSVPAIVSGVAVTGKVDSGFKEVLSRISEAHPDSELASHHTRKTIKQSQTERIVKKWASAH
jgi:predicted nucleic acid-binding Zn ribbon protein